MVANIGDASSSVGILRIVKVKTFMIFCASNVTMQDIMSNRVLPYVWTAGKQLTRIYAEPMLACVADNRKMMRDAAIAALGKVTLVGGAKRLCSVRSIFTLSVSHV